MAADDHAQMIEDALIDMHVDDIKAEFQKDTQHNQMVVVGSVENPEDAQPLNTIEYVTIYNTKDGRPVPILPSMLKAKLSLRWRRAADVPEELWGKRVWSPRPVQDPPVKRKTRNLNCMLADDDENREFYTSLGIDTTCSRVKLPNKMAQRLHMERKHPAEWAIIKDYEETQRKDEERAEQRALTAALAGVVEGRGAQLDAETIASIVTAVMGNEKASEQPPAKGKNAKS